MADGAGISKGEVVEHLLGAGFDVVRVAAPVIPAQAAAGFRERLADGVYDVMPWLGRTMEERLDPRRFLSDVRSVVVVAVAYGSPRARGESRREEETERGRIASYALGWDYHCYVGERLRAAAEWIASRDPSVRTRVAVDAEPVLEKALAVSAGVGWLGRHGLVVSPLHGSRIVLGELFTTLPLEPDPPLPGECDGCDSCIRACPSGALVGPGTLDPGRCVSFRTVESRRTELDEADDLRGWVFGCDSCQEACPADATAAPGSASGFSAKVPREARERYLDMSDEEFERVFRGTAVMRGRRRGLRGGA